MIRVSKLFLLVALVVVLFLAMSVTAQAADTKGKIKTVNSDKNEFVMADDQGKNWTFHCDKDCKVTLNGKEGKLADLQADDMVDITYTKDGDKLNATAVRCTRK